VPVVLPHLQPAQAPLLTEELAYQQALVASPAWAGLPRGAIHADLFRDNVMFDGLPGHERLTGLLDFFFAGTDTLLFDLAVCLNDWCTEPESGNPVDDRAVALVAAYERVRPLSPAEHRLLPALLRAAALRFWLSRLWDLHLPRDASLLKPHDPTHFERVLRARIARPWHPPR
jgi:homoserine kinase type II